MGHFPPRRPFMIVDQPSVQPSSSTDRWKSSTTAVQRRHRVDRLNDLGPINDAESPSTSARGKKNVGFQGLVEGSQGHRTNSGARSTGQQSKGQLYGRTPNNWDGRPPDISHLRVSSLAELKDRRSSMIASKPRDSRRDRTFIGAECAACEEPLEHTLRGERILQLSCGHVSHEACFYEYIKEFDAQSCPNCDAPLGLDTRRGAGIDFENFNKLVRSVQTPDLNDQLRETQNTPTPWETDGSVGQRSPERSRQPPRMNREHLLPEHTRANASISTQHGRQVAPHGRNRSGDTGIASSSDYAETQQTNLRRHDYDVHSMETTLSNPSRHQIKNPIPAPTVTVRSEFPTLSKSKHQQSLTCLITVEMQDGCWKPAADSLRSPPLVPATIPEETNAPVAAPKPVPSQTPKAVRHVAHDSVHEEHEALAAVKEELYSRCENWHGLDFGRFGRLILHGNVRVGKDRQTWQELECYLFTEMLICVKAKKISPNPSQQWENGDAAKRKPKVSLKGSILIKKHLEQVETMQDYEILTLSLSVAELPQFHLQFREHAQLEVWRKALLNLNRGDEPEPNPAAEPVAAESEQDTSATDEDDYATQASKVGKRGSSMHSSSYGASRSQVTAPTEYTNTRAEPEYRPNLTAFHVPLDIVVVIPVSSSMQGLKINLLRDSLRFLVAGLGERDRMGLVTFGSGGGGVPLVGMTTKSWPGWLKVLEQIRPIGQKNPRADVVDGANVAMDLLMQRKTPNPLSSIMLISDSATADLDSVDFVVSRAEAAKITIHSFGLGLTHKPDTLVELSTRTKASYTYIKDWMMLRECLGGCLGSLQSTSHQNVKLKLRLPEGSLAKFVKISGALSITKRATGRDAEASLGDLRFGDKRDILVQLAIAADSSTSDSVPADPWENIISGLEALGGPLDSEDGRTLSVEEVPLIQADLTWADILRDGSLTQLPRPSLLAITMLPSSARRNTQARPGTPPIPPHPQIVQRRMELLTSDMLSRSLTLVSRGQNDRASHLLAETRSILKGLGKGGLPPLPPPPTAALPPTPKTAELKIPHEAQVPLPEPGRTPSPPRPDPLSRVTPAAAIDVATMTALDSELEASLEWISHPAVFSRDTRKAVLQAIGVISSQRAYTFRTPAESLWASRVSGIRRLAEFNRDWREASDESLMEESS